MDDVQINKRLAHFQLSLEAGKAACLVDWKKEEMTSLGLIYVDQEEGLIFFPMTHHYDFLDKMPSIFPKKQLHNLRIQSGFFKDELAFEFEDATILISIPHRNKHYSRQNFYRKQIPTLLAL